MEPLRETLVIAEQDLAHALRTVKAVVFLAIYALLTIGAGLIVIWLLNQIEAQVSQATAGMAVGPDQMAAARDAAYVGLMQWFVGDAETAKYLAEVPVIVLFFFWASWTWLPLLIAVMSFDQISGEVQNRSIRYVTLRARRGSLVAGKLLSNMVLLVALTVATNLIILGFAAWSVEDLPLGKAFFDLVHFWLLLLPYGFTWLALMSWISSSVRASFLALILGIAALLLIKILAFTFSAAGGYVSWLPQLKWIFPTSYQGLLLSHRATQQLLGAGALTAFGLLFSGLSWLTLARRDV